MDREERNNADREEHRQRETQTERNADSKEEGWDRWHFTTRRPISMAPPSPTPHPHKNHQVTALGRAESTRGLLAATFSAGENWSFGAFLGGTIEVAFCNWVGNFNSSAWSHTSLIPQSSSDRVGAGGVNQGIAGGHIFCRGKLEFWGIWRG